MAINHTKTIAEILRDKSAEEQEEWLRNNAIRASESSAIQGLPIPVEYIIDAMKKQNPQ